MLIVANRHDNVMPAWHALPSWLKRHGYKSPTISTDTSFSQGHRIPADKTFFQFLKENPWNANEFNLFMKVHRSWRETWLDRPEVRNIFPQGPSNQRHYYEENNIERYQYVFVDVGGGIGQQCRVCPGFLALASSILKLNTT